MEIGRVREASYHEELYETEDLLSRFPRIPASIINQPYIHKTYVQLRGALTSPAIYAGLFSKHPNKRGWI
jgi:hypothetical protein